MTRLLCVAVCISVSLIQLASCTFSTRIRNIEDFLKENVFDDIYQEDTSWYNPPINSHKLVDEAPEYDFIVIGSGSAGSVIANRLSENPNWNVLLIEAGGGADILTDIPILAPALLMSEYNWGYKMEKQPGIGYGLTNQQINWPRGKALGGSTVINYMVYTRGHPMDYDRWAANGNPGWSYEEVLPYFIKSERMYNVTHAEIGFHSTKGLLSVQYAYQSPLMESFLKAGSELGYPIVDYTTPHEIGFSRVLATVRNGRRHSVASAFLLPVFHRTNLKILTSSYVTKILIDPGTQQAYGVQYVRNRMSYVARVKKEVILSAGALNSPKILMLSGIGPKEHLCDMEIPVIEDLPVGKNLHDHLTYIGLVFSVNDSVVLSLSGILGAKSIYNFLADGTGPLSCIGGVEGIGFVRTNASNEAADFPDIELLFIAGSLNTDYGLLVRPSMNIAKDSYEKFWAPLEGTNVFTIFPMLLHPSTKGFMVLRSNNPFDPPKFYGNYFLDKNKKDIKTMTAAIKLIIKLSQTAAFQRYNARLSNIPVPGCEELEMGSDIYWECALRSLTVNIHHQAGTCKMGPRSDKTSVVGPDLKVHGIKRLRVADASVIPNPISGHNNGPTIMIGEKAADFIINTYRYNQN